MHLWLFITAVAVSIVCFKSHVSIQNGITHVKWWCTEAQRYFYISEWNLFGVYRTVIVYGVIISIRKHFVRLFLKRIGNSR